MDDPFHRQRVHEVAGLENVALRGDRRGSGPCARAARTAARLNQNKQPRSHSPETITGVGVDREQPSPLHVAHQVEEQPPWTFQRLGALASLRRNDAGRRAPTPP